MDNNNIEIIHYFDPVKPEIVEQSKHLSEATFSSIQKNTKENPVKKLEGFDIAILGIPEERNSNNKACKKAPDAIREKLYQLYKPRKRVKIVDLGNLKPGNTIRDSYFGIKDVVSILLKSNIIPLIIGGSQDITFANYLAYENLEQEVNLVSIDSRFDLGNAEEEFNSQSYLSKIVLEKSSYLFNYTNIGYQTYFINEEEIALMNDLFFDIFRLGNIRSNITETEPMLRDADIVTFDISVVKHSDAPGYYNPSPNGIYAHEACQLARYAGMSDKLTSFGIYEINPDYDINNQTSHLGAQILWHFIEGFYQRKNDYPAVNISQYTKFIVHIEDGDHEIVFYKSEKSGRWWMEIPYPKTELNRSRIVACSHQDYISASNRELPDRWWKYYQKIS